MAFRSLSWGCGLQSTTLAVMSALGDLPRLDAIITSDTKNESWATYRLRDWYIRWLTARNMRVEIVSGGDIVQLGATEHVHIPFWTSDGGPLRRQCTRHFKITPVKRRLREMLGYDVSRPPHPPPGAIEQWLGFSWDEVDRMSDSEVQFISHRYPLIEARMTRNDCEDYLLAHSLPVPPKSACKICPYRQASDWLKLEPDEFAECVEFDNSNRHNPLAERGGSTADELYLWKKAVPLGEVDLEAEAAKERKGKQLPLMVCNSGGCWT